MLKICNLDFSYKRKGAPVLSDFSLEIEKGGIYGLLGRNGVGKSTLLYLIMGALTPTSGKILFDGTDTRHRRPSTLNDMFIIPEELSLPRIRLAEFVGATSQFYPRFSHEDMRRHLDMFGMDSDCDLGSLSMGQKKKVYMSFALACNTSLILMDEPTNGLDIPGKSAFRSFVASNMSDERSIVISTHQVRDIDSLLDHVVIMNESKVLLNESIAKIAENLKFVTTDSAEVAGRALYARPGIGGTSVIMPNDDGSETEVNIESLFELAIANPDIIAQVFHHKSTQQ